MQSESQLSVTSFAILDNDNREQPTSIVRAGGQSYWYHPELDILRFVAFLAVFAFHGIRGLSFHPFVAGQYGVDLFFALSAYLITEVLLREERARGKFDIKAFYVRRILRIWPLYFAFLAVAFWVEPLILKNEFFSWPQRIMHLLFVGNWVFLLHQPFQTSANPLWSVSIEEQFYLVWPLLLRWTRASLRWFCVGLLLIATLYRLAIVVLHPHKEIDVLWRSTFSRVDAIILGSMLAVLLHGKIPELSRMQRWLIGGMAVLGMLVGARLGSLQGWRSLATYPAMAFFSVAILVAVLRPNNCAPSGKVHRVLVHLGQISYGLYVFHMFCLHFCWQEIAIPNYPHAMILLQPIAGLLLTIALAECSYWGLEKPFLRLKNRFSVVRTSTAS